MVQIYDLTTSHSTEDKNQGTSSIKGEGVPDNISYTWITVKSVAKNFQVSTNSSSPSGSITNAPFSNAPSSGSDGSPGSSVFSATSRLTSSIALHLPKNLPYSWSNDWSQAETSVVEEAIYKASTGDVVDGFKSVADQMANVVINLAGKTSLNKAMQRNLGITANPFKEMYYNGVGFRQFTFSWDFAPQNIKESQTLEKLIQDLELASHPELIDGEGSGFIIPDVFDIVFVGTRAPRIMTAALTNMTVDYGNNGPKFFKDGFAGFVEMTLSFTELIPLTRKEIREAHALNTQGSRAGETASGGR